MAWRGHLSRNLKELRLLFCQSSPASAQTREFVQRNYKDLKTLNPKLPILIRECSGVEPQLWARYADEESCFILKPLVKNELVEEDSGKEEKLVWNWLQVEQFMREEESDPVFYCIKAAWTFNLGCSSYFSNPCLIKALD
ncbi:Ribosomal protein/NADH dehydrogenase domain [Macleaya cordata]|uniref:Ribosomal protein/NADH dehydrogenase domain n=1 Tax=Macleaya cordata TaxID=56857 RepID=A0A200QCD7_MACCD|nr:Ribosomal protein/NADH dehydrogenase domain [Macleaya cordata]